MLKVLIWQVSNDTSFKDKAIKILEQQHNGIEIVGEAVTENIAKVDGGGQYDLILVVGARSLYGNAKMSKVMQDAKQFNLPEEKILGDHIVCIPGFTLEKYRQLQHSRLSIFSINCFGGVISNQLNLPFLSPFINLTIPMEHFLKFLREPRIYLDKEPSFDKIININSNNPNGFPLFSLGGLSLNMVHYGTSEEAIREAINKWNERKQRINWDNLFVVAHTSREDLLEQFDALPYKKKICFVPFKSNLDSAWYYMNPNRGDDGAIDFARGLFFCYDQFDMLLYGKKTPLIETLPNPKEQPPVKASAEAKNHFYFLSNSSYDTAYDRQDILSRL